MAGIKHIALVCKDPRKLGKFYQEAFGFHVCEVVEPSGVTVVSDGNFNLTLLHERADLPNHFGIQMSLEEIEASRARLEALGAKFHEPKRDGVRAVEIYLYDPEGNRVDLAPYWPLQPGENSRREDDNKSWNDLEHEQSQLGKRAAEVLTKA